MKKPLLALALAALSYGGGATANDFPTQARDVSAPGTALLTRIDDGALGRVSSEGGGVEPGGQQGFDLGE